MRIRGRFQQLGAPYIKVGIVCKQLGINDTIDFLVDLGASVTMISPRDARRLGIRYRQLQIGKGGVTGVGGRAKTCSMPATQLIFKTETGNFKADFHRLLVLQPVGKTLSKTEKLIPSLLGRDFLNQMALLTDKRQNLVLITDEVLAV